MSMQTSNSTITSNRQPPLPLQRRDDDGGGHHGRGGQGGGDRDGQRHECLRASFDGSLDVPLVPRDKPRHALRSSLLRADGGRGEGGRRAGRHVSCSQDRRRRAADHAPRLHRALPPQQLLRHLDCVGAPVSNSSPSPPPHAQGVCSSGFLQPAVQEELKTALRARDGALATAYYVDNDSPGCVYTAAGGAGGMVIISGTGSMTMLIDRAGAAHNCGGWGHLFGDGAWFPGRVMGRDARRNRPAPPRPAPRRSAPSLVTQRALPFTWLCAPSASFSARWTATPTTRRPTPSPTCRVRTPSCCRILGCVLVLALWGR